MSVIVFSNREIVVRGRALEAWYFWNIHSVPVFVSFFHITGFLYVSRIEVVEQNTSLG